MTLSTIEQWRWRSDVLDFHAGWHANFPWTVRWNNPGQGAEFLYFHRQFLAWYTAERVARGLGMVPDWDPSQPIADGHTNFNGAIRPANWYIPGASQAPFEVPSWFTEPGGAGAYVDPTVGPAPGGLKKLADFDSVDILGKALEHPWHNTGHGTMGGLFATSRGNGDMSSVGLASRDPFFFMWHRRIDNVWRAWSELAAVQLPAVQHLPVLIRDGGPPNGNGTDSPDIIIRRTRLTNPSAELGDFNATPPSDQVYAGENAYLYARVKNTSDQTIEGRAHFFCAPVSLAHNRRYWIELPQTNSGAWGTPVSLGPNESQVIRSGPMPGAVVWDARLIPAPNVYRMLVAVLPNDAPRGYPFERALPPGGTVQDIVQNNPWIAWRDFEIVERPELHLDDDLMRRLRELLQRRPPRPWPPLPPGPHWPPLPPGPWPGPGPDPVPWRR